MDEARMPWQKLMVKLVDEMNPSASEVAVMTLGVRCGRSLRNGTEQPTCRLRALSRIGQCGR